MLSKIKCIKNCLCNRYYGKINRDYLILCDDGNGSYQRKYGDLINELIKEYDDYELAVKENRFRHTIGDELIINGLLCKINFFGTHYCGYVIDKSVQSYDYEKIYQAHGGYTAGQFGFDCAHSGDIVLYNYEGNIGFPYEPKFFINKNSSFKTRKFVINELRKITKSLNNLN